MFENVDSVSVREARDTLQLSGEAWARHVRPLLDAGLIAARGNVPSLTRPRPYTRGRSLAPQGRPRGRRTTLMQNSY
ncbi:hypothetical protein RR48_00121 [Papilio machaon]|uniref:Uncharacterized protein n=1 Tax=Papilio machaon TaxID=76193 RepID=A0A0N1II96_PAPMA|nr:hypothetical protein RR48_00121 [Papilio machaon]